MKPFRLAAIPTSAGGLAKDELEHLRSCDLQWPLHTEKVSIDWTSDEHNLLKKKPRVNPTDLEEFDLYVVVPSPLIGFLCAHTG